MLMTNTSVTFRQHHSTTFPGALLATAGGICWGLSGTMGQYLFTHENMDSRWLVPLRLGFAGLILLFYCIFKDGPRKTFGIWRSKRDARTLVIYGLAGVSCCQFLYFLTIQLSTAGVGTILQDFSPIMILLYTCVQKRRRPTARQLSAITLALAGVALITTHGDFTTLSVSPAALVTGILSAVCVTIYNVTPGDLMDRYSVLLLQAWAFLMGSAAILLIFRPWTFHYVPSAMGCFGVFFVVVVGNVLAFPLYIQGVKLIGPEKGILYGFSEPLTAAFLGTVLLGSPFTGWDALGFALVFLMLFLISGKKA
ncbi:MAG: DMT family transporter [Lachnospiraceae bacterium]|nr:DMT family transporter [Lachnospiraceae bacterium]